MDVLICLQKLLRCYLFLILTVINKDGESKFKSIPWIVGNLPLPQTNLVCHYLTFPSVFFHSISQSPSPCSRQKKCGTMLWVEFNELPSALKSEFRVFSFYELALTVSKELNEIHMACLVWRLLSHNLLKKKNPLICYGFKEWKTAAGRGYWRGSKHGKAFVTDR